MNRSFLPAAWGPFVCDTIYPALMLVEQLGQARKSELCVAYLPLLVFVIRSDHAISFFLVSKLKRAPFPPYPGCPSLSHNILYFVRYPFLVILK